MPLIYKHGPVSVGKTIELCKQAYQIQRIHGKEFVKVIKPSFDIRDGNTIIKSACGLNREVDYVILASDNLCTIDWTPETFILVDEIQFFTVEQIEQMRKISLEKNITIICYGLLKDFRNDMFESCARLIEVADEVKQINTFCYCCSKKRTNQNGEYASFNMKIFIDESGKMIPTQDGESKECGGIEKYIPVCSKCWFLSFKEVELTPYMMTQNN